MGLWDEHRKAVPDCYISSKVACEAVQKQRFPLCKTCIFRNQKKIEIFC